MSTNSTSPPPSPAPLFEPLYLLFVAFPAALYFKYAGFEGLWIFITSCVAIIPLAGLMGRATESLADSMGAGIGGLLNATFGNAAELIIALLALKNGETELVKASITGSIIGNILLVLGLSILVGGIYHPRQVFNRTSAGLGTTLLALASIGLIFPTIHYYLSKTDQAPNGDIIRVEMLSEEIAGILAGMYILSLFFTFSTHRHLFAGPECGPEERSEPEWGRTVSFTVLLVATAGVALMSELLVESVQAAAVTLGLNKLFIGVIVVAVIGNAAEHSTAVLMAMKNKMDLAVTIAVGSSIQIAMFVAPVLVFSSIYMGHPLDLHFSLMEVFSVVISIGVMSLVSQDGECHWMEGALLLAVYVIIGLSFYHLPG